MASKQDAPFLLTVDVEPDWGISGARCISETLPRFCGMLGRLGIRATFFVVADLTRTDCGEVLRRELRDHEVGSHGLTHRVLLGMPRDEIARELRESRRQLETFFGRPVTGFRAPFLKMPPGLVAMLAEAGYRYDSSQGAVAPSPANATPSRWRAEWRGGIAEIPVASFSCGWIPFSLTYLRLLAPLSRRMVSGQEAILYLHLHELADPALARGLPLPLRCVLRRNAGEAAWPILEGTLARFAARAITCGEYMAAMRPA